MTMLLYLIIGFVLAMLNYLIRPERYTKDKFDKIFEFFPGNISHTQAILFAFAIHILSWPICILFAIDRRIRGEKYDD